MSGADDLKPAGEKPRYASFVVRFVAYALDNLLIFAVTFLVFAITLRLTGKEHLDSVEAITCMIWLVYGFYTLASIGYFTILVGGGGQTVGKWLFGIKVTLADGGNVSYGRAFLRCFGYYVSALFLYIGFLIALIDPRSQTFHDKITGTVVVEI